jgi:hypothetical protein
MRYQGKNSEGLKEKSEELLNRIRESRGALNKSQVYELCKETLYGKSKDVDMERILDCLTILGENHRKELKDRGYGYLIKS